MQRTRTARSAWRDGKKTPSYALSYPPASLSPPPHPARADASSSPQDFYELKAPHIGCAEPGVSPSSPPLFTHLGSTMVFLSTLSMRLRPRFPLLFPDAHAVPPSSSSSALLSLPLRPASDTSSPQARALPLPSKPGEKLRRGWGGGGRRKLR